MALTDQLVEFWTLNDTLVGHKGNTLVSPDGLTHYVAGILGNAWEVAATANRVPILNPSPINPGNSDWTLSLWVYYDGTSVSGTVVRLRDGTATKLRVVIAAGYDPDNEIWYSGVEVYFGATLATRVFSDSTFAGDDIARWKHLVVRFTAGSPGTLDVFLDTEKKSLAPATDLAIWTSPISQIGGGTTPHLSSAIDAAGWWSRALSDGEVAALNNAGAGWEPSAADNTPDAFTFTDQTGAARNVQIQSDVETITGMDAATAVSITGGEYSLDGGAYTSAPGTINPGQTLRLRVTSAATYDTDVQVTVTVGTYSTTWTVRTGLPSSRPLLLARAV